jgi:formate hydrogenlyase subunit 3/multisubunit Na+/H+ antiporter MnhD subunit
MPAGLGDLTFALDEIGASFLALFAFVWILSGIYAWFTVPAGDRARLFAYYLPAAVGGIAVAAAADAISFYLCFALMAIPAWGLIAHPRTHASRRAAAIYLSVTAVSEALLLAALVLMVNEAGGLSLTALRNSVADAPTAGAITALLLLSIGLKIGTLPASGILPIMYGHGPSGAAAALAGASTKVGALALVRLMPAGTMPEGWTAIVMVLGLATAFGAAVLGVLTTTPRAVLGYSSASQMGLILVAAAASLSAPDAVSLAYGAVVAFSLHHGLAKGALMLGDDVVSRLSGRARALALAALAIPAISLVGVPLSSGFVAKYALKDAVHAVHGPVPEAVYALIPFTAIGTAALMIRFYLLVRRRPQQPATAARTPTILWAVMLTVSVVAVWIWPAQWNTHAIESAFDVGSMWSAIWPALTAIAGAYILRLAPARVRRLGGSVPPGDVLHTAARWVRGLDGLLGASRRSTHESSKDGRQLMRDLLMSTERRLVAWTAATTLFAALAILLILLSTR